MRHISFRANGKARRTLIAVMVVILFEVMRMPGADAQSVSVSRAFDLLSQFCLKEFPDVAKISDAVKRADWKFISGDADVACRDNSFAGQRLSDKLKSYRVFRAQLDGKPLNFVFVNSFDIPAYHEMIVTQIRVLDSDPKN